MRPFVLLLMVSPLVLSACPTPVEEPPPQTITDPRELPVGPYDASVRWTEWGIPHVLADDWGSAGFAIGRAHAVDHGCTVFEQIVKVRSERARWFGRGTDDAHVDSDFGWLALDVMGQAERGFLSLEPQMQSALVGYAAGFNAYLDEVGLSGLAAPCRDAEWVQPFDHVDLLAYYLALGLSGSGAVFIENIAQATPPDGSRAEAVDPRSPEVRAAFHEWLRPVREPDWGSNGWGIGADMSSTDGGLLLSNTHFPFEGPRRWWEFQITIPPEEVNVYGSSLVGIAAVNIGFNEHIAWTHTVSSTPRFTAYALQLEPGNPTSYLWDGDYIPMESKEFSVQVESFGSLATETRTLWYSRFGPVVNAPLVGWTDTVAFTFRDGNANNLQMLGTWFGMNRATDLDSFRAAHRDLNGIPWVHTLYADDAGNAFYTDSASAPLLTDAAWDGWRQYVQDDTFASLFADNGAILLPGDDPLYDWHAVDGARMPGLVPFDDAPQLERRDFVANANNNHWLTNPAEPLEGYSPIYLDERTPRSPRTRMNLMYLMDQGSEAASGGDGVWTLAELEAAALDGRAAMAELLRDDVVARCNGVDVTAWPAGGGDTVDLTQACGLLAAWDGKLRLDSVGAIVWRELLGSPLFTGVDFADEGLFFDVGFDPNDPVATPHTLAPPTDGEPDHILTALAHAVERLGETNLALDAALGDAQFQYKGDTTHAVPGGLGREGAIAISDWSGPDDSVLPVPQRPTVVNGPTELTVDGYAINRGNSWIMAVQFGDDGPDARAVMTYSQSADPDRASFDDQSRDLYANGAFRDVLFTEEEIAADPALVVEDLHLDAQ